MEATQRELTEALAEHAAATTAHEAAQEAVKTFRESQRAGDRTLSEEEAASALATARGRVTVCEDRLDYAAGRLRRARAGLLNNDTSLAEPIAAALEDMATFAAFNVVATAEKPVIPNSVERPTLYVRQVAAPSLDLIDGKVSGEVLAILHRPAWGRVLELEDLPNALRRVGIHINDPRDLGTAEDGDIREDRASISVRGLFAPVPIIKSANNGLARFAQGLAGRIASELDSGIVLRSGGIIAPTSDVVTTGSTSAFGAVVTGQGAAKVAESHVTGSERHSTVEVAVVLRAKSHLSHNDLVRGATEYLRGMPGKAESGMGRVEAVTTLPSPDDGTRKDGVTRVDARIIFKSGVPES